MSRLRLTVSAVAIALALGGAFAASTVVAQQPPAPPAGAAPPPPPPPTGADVPREPRREGSERGDRRFDREDSGRGRGAGDDYAGDERRERWWRERMRRGGDDGDRRGGPRAREDGPREFGQGPGDPMMGRGRMGRMCGPGGERMGTFMVERLERITRPTDAQRPLFDKLKEAATKAHETMRATCTDEPPPITPPGRMAAAEKRLEAMLGAVRTVRPALDEYYASLSEEQKARLYASRGERGGPQWRDGFDRWRRGENSDRREGGPRQGWRHDDGERRRDSGRERDGWRERGGERWRERRDDNRDDRPDSWRGPS